AWQQVARDDGISVLARTPEGGSVSEVKATTLVDAPPHEVWRVIRDYTNYTKTMPYTQESRVLASEQEGKVTVFYCLVNAPLVDKRDFIIRIRDESDWKDGQGFLKSAWTVTTDGAPAVRDGVVRVKLNNGYWLLEPREEGKKTFVTYYLYTDPGGSLPKWIADKANKTSVPDVLRAVRKHATAAKE
ncbi:MAG TPA: START domain-containing protein, partial [Archangium sp.]|nr:START domain-containing protein [Archangium sp.]